MPSPNRTYYKLMAAEGPTPFEDTIVIPYSRSTLKRYEMIINELQTILLETTQNRTECLKRSVTGIIPHPAGLRIVAFVLTP